MARQGGRRRTGPRRQQDGRAAASSRDSALNPAGSACPCGRLDARRQPLALALCCGRYLGHFEDTAAPDAESLMRSRYSAFVLEDAPYLLATWHPSTRPPRIEFEAGLKWLGLEVRMHRMTAAGRAEVEFVARSRLAGRAHRLHERSRFVHEHGRWFYVDGEVPPATRENGK